MGHSRLSCPVSISVSRDPKPFRGRGAWCVIVTFTCFLCASLFFPVQTPQCQHGLCLPGKCALSGGLSQPEKHSEVRRGGRVTLPVSPSCSPLADSKAPRPHAGPECARLRGPCERARAPTGAPRPETEHHESGVRGSGAGTQDWSPALHRPPCQARGGACPPGRAASPSGLEPPGIPRREQRAPPWWAMLV